MRVLTVVGQSHPVFTELLEIILTARTRAAGIDHATDRREIAFPEFLNFLPDLDDAADNFMPGHTRILGAATPLVARDMQIGMANAAKENLDLDVVRQRIAPFEGKRGEGRASGLGSVGFG